MNDGVMFDYHNIDETLFNELINCDFRTDHGVQRGLMLVSKMLQGKVDKEKLLSLALLSKKYMDVTESHLRGLAFEQDGALAESHAELYVALYDVFEAMEKRIREANPQNEM